MGRRVWTWSTGAAAGAATLETGRVFCRRTVKHNVDLPGTDPFDDVPATGREEIKIKIKIRIRIRIGNGDRGRLLKK
jgi:hypothetical protein